MIDSMIQLRVNHIINQYAHGTSEVTEHSHLQRDLGLNKNEVLMICQDVEDEFQISKFTNEQIDELDTPACIALRVVSKRANQLSNFPAPKRFSNLGIPSLLMMVA